MFIILLSVLNTNENIEYQNYLTELSSFGINKLGSYTLTLLTASEDCTTTNF